MLHDALSDEFVACVINSLCAAVKFFSLRVCLVCRCCASVDVILKIDIILQSIQCSDTFELLCDL